MGNEINLFKELANISMSVCELASVKSLIWQEVEDPEFREHFANLLCDIVNSYRLVNVNLEPLVSIDTPTRFTTTFDDSRNAFA